VDSLHVKRIGIEDLMGYAFIVRVDYGTAIQSLIVLG
jgi:hypothetical protein